MRKKVSAFGVGNHYVTHRDYIHEKYEIEAFYDNDVNKIGTTVDGIIVKDPKTVKGKILITSIYKYEIIPQLLSAGIMPEDIYFMPEEWMGIYGIKPVCVDSFGGGIRVGCCGITVDLHNPIEEMIYRESFLREDYNINTGKDTIVIDIGLNVGFASLFFASKNNIKKIYSFEPDKKVYERAMHNIGLNEKEIKDRIETYPVALGKENSKEYYVVNSLESAGISKRTDSDTKEGLIEIEVVDAYEYIKPIMEKHFGKEKIVIKSDCEGAEYDIFYRLESMGIFNKIDAFVMEWHSGRRSELEDLFIRNGYTFIIFDTPGREFGKCYAVKTKL